MKQQSKNIKSMPLKNARELAAILKQLPKDDRLRIEGAIIWASVALAVVGVGALTATMITRRRHTTPDPINGDGVSMRDE